MADYLLKPISFERFLKAVEHVQARLATSIAPEEAFASAAPAPAETGSYIFLKVDNRLVKVDHADICYIEGGKEYATVVTTTAKILTMNSLAKLAESLPRSRFLRVHKSYIVALDKIEAVERQRIYLAPLPQAIIPIGETYRAAFNRALGHLS